MARRITNPYLLAAASLVLLAALLAVLRWHGSSGGPAAARQTLLVYCGAGLKVPVEAAAKAYERECGVRVQLQFGGSHTLLANIEVSRKGDLYLPADEWYLQAARDKNLVDETIPVARVQPVLAVAKSNPKNVKSLGDLSRDGVRLCQANPDATAVGKLVRDALQKTGQWDGLKQHTLVFKPTVNDVANDIKLGAADAGFVWDATVRQYPELEGIALPELSGSVAHIGVGILCGSTERAAAQQFARYLAAPGKGAAEFQRYGYTPAAGEEPSPARERP